MRYITKIFGIKPFCLRIVQLRDNLGLLGIIIDIIINFKVCWFVLSHAYEAYTLKLSMAWRRKALPVCLNRLKHPYLLDDICNVLFYKKNNLH